MPKYGTYQGAEKALGHISKTFSGLMETKQRQVEKEAEAEYKNRVFKRGVLESNREFELRKEEGERAGKKFDVNIETLEAERDKIERENKIAEEKFQRDNTLISIDTNPFFSRIKQAAPNTYKAMSDEIVGRKLAESNPNDPNLITGKVKYINEYIESFNKDPNKVRTFLDMGSAEINQQIRVLDEKMAEPMNDKNRQMLDQKKEQLVMSLNALVVHRGNLQTAMEKSEREQKLKLGEERRGLEKAKILETQKQAGREKLKKMGPDKKPTAKKVNAALLDRSKQAVLSYFVPNIDTLGVKASELKDVNYVKSNFPEDRKADLSNDLEWVLREAEKNLETMNPREAAKMAWGKLQAEKSPGFKQVSEPQTGDIPFSQDEIREELERRKTNK